jgi:hypothetical protein
MDTWIRIRVRIRITNSEPDPQQLTRMRIQPRKLDLQYKVVIDIYGPMKNGIVPSGECHLGPKSRDFQGTTSSHLPK